MTLHSHQLPKSKTLDIAALSRMFEPQRTTNSYKFLFFLALIEKLETQVIQDSQPIQLTLKEITTEMVLLAWYPAQFFKLSFGPLDQVAKIINALNFDAPIKAITSLKGKAQLRIAIEQQASDIGIEKLERYVPYLLQSVFFSEELKGIKSDTKRKKIIIAEAGDHFRPKVSLYSYTQYNNLPAIKMNHEWLRYLLGSVDVSLD